MHDRADLPHRVAGEQGDLHLDAWIDAALLRALRLRGERDIVLVSHGPPSPALRDLVHASDFGVPS